MKRFKILYIIDKMIPAGAQKHLKDKKLGIIGFTLFALGFAFQIVGIIIQMYRV